MKGGRWRALFSHSDGDGWKLLMSGQFTHTLPSGGKGGIQPFKNNPSFILRATARRSAHTDRLSREKDSLTDRETGGQLFFTLSRAWAQVGCCRNGLPGDDELWLKQRVMSLVPPPEEQKLWRCSQMWKQHQPQPKMLNLAFKNEEHQLGKRR